MFSARRRVMFAELFRLLVLVAATALLGAAIFALLRGAWLLVTHAV